MNKIDDFIQKISLKKVVIGYIVGAIIALLLSLTLLGVVYKDKLLFAYNYIKVTEKFEEGREEVESDLTSLAQKSADIVDILVLDSNNNITFSANNSEFSEDGKFLLSQTGNKQEQYLTYTQDPNVTFILVEEDKLMFSTVFLDYERELEYHFKNNNFFEENYNSKNIYLLSYTIDKNTGDKIYFISDIHPVQYGVLAIKIVSAILILFLMLYWVLIALWVYRDSRKSKSNAILWGIITLFTNIAGLFIYLIYKQNSQSCHHCGAIQNKGNIYCSNCGLKIRNTCDDCNYLINKADNFCNHCGKKL